MKKIFLIVGFSSFGFTYAQQNDVIDIQKYLENKNKKEKAGTFTNPLSGAYFPPLCGTYYRDSFTLSNGNKVHSLPQDNMPCVIPDMSQFNMPVIKPGLSPYTIPNLAYPPQSKIEPVTAEKLKELLELLNKTPNK
jgi:hypothetical protein